VVAFSAILAVLMVEAALRIVYFDAGARTLGGPGGVPFEHETTDGLRGRRDVGPKVPGVPRVMVIGDSVTYGLGVRDWKATWPELLSQALERDGRPHQFAVLAVPGNDMPQHLDTIRNWIGSVQPDVLIYQWYVNDIEAISHRPDIEQPWQHWSWHAALREHSYLYFVLDHRLTQWLSRPATRYVGYLRSDFKPGSLEWAEFEREFHEFAVLAKRAPRRIMMLYPQVPFNGTYPLQAVHDRMRALTGPHALEIPPIAWTRTAGSLVPRRDARFGQAVQASQDTGTLEVQTAAYVYPPGEVELHLQAMGVPTGRVFGSLELIDAARGAVAASASLCAGRAEDMQVRLRLPGDRIRLLAVRVRATAADGLALGNISLPVDYGFEVVDLTEPLNQFDTHASSFDSHPNARAHQAMADIVYAAMTSSR
jgi:hypothetical protein